jgi:hypothetical protein
MMDPDTLDFEKREAGMSEEIRYAIRGETLGDGSAMFWVFNDTDGERGGPYLNLATAEDKLDRATVS